MLDEGLDIEARDTAGATPLHCAVFYMQRPVIALLLSRGAAINTRDAQARLHAAVERPTLLQPLAHLRRCMLCMGMDAAYAHADALL